MYSAVILKKTATCIFDNNELHTNSEALLYVSVLNSNDFNSQYRTKIHDIYLHICVREKSRSFRAFQMIIGEILWT